MQSYTIEVSTEGEDFLLDFSHRSGITLAETLGRAIALLALADEEKRKGLGHRIGIVKEVGDDELEAVGYVRGY